MTQGSWGEQGAPALVMTNKAVSYTHLTPAALESMLKEAGFRNIHTDIVDREPEPPHFLSLIHIFFHGCVSPGSQGLPGLLDIPSGAP